MRRNPWSITIGLVIVAVGIVWMVDNVVGFEVPWEWVLPILLVVFGLLVAFGRGPDDGAPPSQFERDGAPPVP